MGDKEELCHWAAQEGKGPPHKLACPTERASTGQGTRWCHRALQHCFVTLAPLAPNLLDPQILFIFSYYREMNDYLTQTRVCSRSLLQGLLGQIEENLRIFLTNTSSHFWLAERVNTMDLLSVNPKFIVAMAN